MTAKGKSGRGRINENFIFIQAFSLFQQAQAEEKTSFIKALNLYKQTVSLIDSIPDKFPSSSLALKIAQRRFRLGKTTYSGIQKKIESLRLKASHEETLEILHDCARNLSQPEQRAEKLSDIALLFHFNGQKSHCLRVLSEASEAAEDIAEPSSRSRLLHTVALKYAEIGEFERALTLSVFFTDLSDQIRLLTDLGSTYYQKKMLERARQLFFNAIELAERATDEEQSAALASWIAYRLAESEEYFWALEVAESIACEEHRYSAIHQIVERLISSGKFFQEFARKIDRPDSKAELMVSLAMKYAADGYFSQAREAVESIGSISLKSQALLAVASEYREKIHQSSAVELVNEALNLSARIIEPEARIHSIVRACGILAFHKQDSRVAQLIEQSVKLVATIPQDDRRPEFYTYLVKNALELNQLAIAEEIVPVISDKNARNRAISDIAVRHAFLDNFSLAQKKIATIDDPFQKFQAIFRIIDINPENRNLRAKFALLNEIVENLPQLQKLENSDQILAECSVHLARLEKFHSALQVQEAIKSDQTRDELLWKLAELKFHGDFFIEGIEIIRLIKNQDSRISRLIQLGVAIHSGKYQSETFKIYDFLPVAFSFWLEEKEIFEIRSLQNKL